MVVGHAPHAARSLKGNHSPVPMLSSATRPRACWRTGSGTRIRRART
jgi:hypothetical protein